MNTLLQLVYARQKKWFQRVLSMNHELIANIVVQRKVEGTKRRRKSRTTWMSAIEERTGFSLHQDREKSKQKIERSGEFLSRLLEPTSERHHSKRHCAEENKYKNIKFY